MTFRRNLIWTSVAFAAALTIGVPSMAGAQAGAGPGPAAQAPAGQGQGQGQQGGTLDKTWKTTDGDGDSDDVVEPNRQGQEQGTPR